MSATVQTSGRILLSIPQAAARMTISRRQYYRLAQRDEVPRPVTMFGVTRVPQDEIDALIEARLAARKTAP